MKEPEITDCACGCDHEEMPMIDAGFDDPLLVEAVCRVHKRHVPCRPCLRARVPELTDEQRAVAAVRSLAIRRARAEAKQGLLEAEDPVSFLAYLWDKEPILGMQVVDLLMALPYVGRLKAGRLIDKAGIKPNRHVRGVGPKQRDRLFELLLAR